MSGVKWKRVDKDYGTMSSPDKERLMPDSPSPVRYTGFEEEKENSKKHNKPKTSSTNGENGETSAAEQNRANERSMPSNGASQSSSEYSGTGEQGEEVNRQLVRNGRADSYVELMRGSVPCPTCRGAGNIPKEQENQLVALIPVRDSRLKPRRTWLYVLLAVVFCVVVAGLLIFFMFPRDVTLASDVRLLLPVNLVINETNQYVSFSVKNLFNITNSNFFSVKLTTTTMQIIFDGKVLNTTHENQTIEVGLRSSAAFSVPIGITFSKENGFAEMVKVCSLPYRFLHQRYMVFNTNTNYNFLGRSEEATLSQFPLVSCGNDTDYLQGRR